MSEPINGERHALLDAQAIAKHIGAVLDMDAPPSANSVENWMRDGRVAGGKRVKLPFVWVDGTRRATVGDVDEFIIETSNGAPIRSIPQRKPPVKATPPPPVPMPPPSLPVGWTSTDAARAARVMADAGWTPRQLEQEAGR